MKQHLHKLSLYCLKFLQELKTQALEPAKIEALLQIVEEDLGPELFKSVEGTKQRLSKESRVVLSFNEPPTCIESAVERALFEQWITVQLKARGLNVCADQNN